LPFGGQVARASLSLFSPLFSIIQTLLYLKRMAFDGNKYIKKFDYEVYGGKTYIKF